MNGADRLGLLRRMARFGAVGVSGLAINQATLYLANEYLFRGVVADDVRLNLSLGVAILLATISNYYWNQRWTWADRVESRHWREFLQRFVRYVGACAVAILVQVVVTQVLVAYGAYYLVANLVAVAVSACANFVLNHLLTFARRASGSAA